MAHGSASGIGISRQRLCGLLASQRTQPVMIVTRTTVRMKKRGNPLAGHGVIKRAGRNGFIGANYASVVNRQRDREQQPIDAEGNVRHFFASSLWRGRGEHVEGNRHLVRHRDTRELYLVFYPRANAQGEPVEMWTRYHRADTDQEIPVELVDPWLLKSNGSRRQRTEKPIPWRAIALSSLEYIRLAGTLYRVLEAAPQEAASPRMDEAPIRRAA